MKKIFSSTVLILLFALTSPSSVSAKLLSIQVDGELVWSVLSSGTDVNLDIPKASYIEITEAAKTKPSKDAKISLFKSGDKVSMLVDTDTYKKELDISGWEESVVEIEERPEIQKLSINIYDGRFAIKQKEVIAVTEYPITIDSKTAKLSVTTESGDRLLSVLPFNAIENLIRTKIITRLANREINIVEEERELKYIVSGEKLINLFDIYNYPVQVNVGVSASTGEVISIEAPLWYKAISFLFT